MIEAGVTLGIAVVAAMATVANRLHSRVAQLDTRLDKFELYSAQTYLPRTDFNDSMGEIKEHMVRIEGKLDQFIQGYRNH